ncbi:MAG: hypothetical protein LLF95_10265 [Bacteroidales bacterium]|nr:hypothetical protein [Bacteroidales bacterium]
MKNHLKVEMIVSKIKCFHIFEQVFYFSSGMKKEKETLRSKFETFAFFRQSLKIGYDIKKNRLILMLPVVGTACPAMAGTQQGSLG